MNDKIWIQNHYLPKLNGDILFVGFSAGDTYKDYPNLIDSGTFTTVDVNLKTEPDYLCDFAYEFKSQQKYDHISLHGLWGSKFHFVDESVSQEHFGHGRETDGNTMTQIILNSIKKAHSLLKVGGTLQIGPNTNNIIPIYDTLIKSNVYKKLYRINRGEGGCGNCIFWGEKITEMDIDFKIDDLWKK